MNEFKRGDKITCPELQHPAEILGVYDTGEYNEYWVRLNPCERVRGLGRVTVVVHDIGGVVKLSDPGVMAYETCEYCDNPPPLGRQRHFCRTCKTSWCRACEGGCMCTNPEGQRAFAEKWGLSMVVNKEVPQCT